MLGAIILFFLGTIGMAIIRGYAPEILGLEKFMDFGFIKSYLVNNQFPAPDLWWAGGIINYYSFGHLLAAYLIKLLGVAPGTGYNLVLAIIFGAGLALSFLIVRSLANKNSIKMVGAGIVGAFLVMIAGNSHSMWYLLTHKSFGEYWYADATRFIYNTIHEFPSYSFVVSDLHAHVLSLPIVLIFIWFLISWSRKDFSLIRTVGLGILLGMMVMTNTWDFLIYGLLMFTLSIILGVGKKKEWKEIFKSLLVIIVTAIIVSLPWWISFKSISNGVMLVKSRSPLWQLGALWGGHLLIVLMAVIASIKFNLKKGRRSLTVLEPFILALCTTSILLILIPEFAYVKDIYPNHPRANTMFKLTYQAFIMMGLIGGWLAFRLSILPRNFKKFGLLAIFLLIVLGLGLFPFRAFPEFYGGFKQYKGLDGLRWLEAKYKAEKEIIAYLEENRNGKNLIEAVGDSYTEYNFVSAFSGIPTVVGWRVHEWLWRGGFDEVGKRETDVKTFYESDDLNETLNLIDKYNLGWIVITSRERQNYQVNYEKIGKLGRVVYQMGQDQLWQIN